MATPGQTVIARAPVRISLAGGGTDLPAYYERFGGLVVSTTIDKYAFVHCTQNGRSGSHYSQIMSADYQSFYRHHLERPLTWDGDLALPRAVLHTLGAARNLSLFVATQVPPGTGLGSSSAVAVALVAATSTFLNWALSRQHMAEIACQVEIGKLGAPIGKQDQFASAYGGLNALAFERGRVTVERLKLPPGVQEGLERRLKLFFTGTARDSATILKGQQAASRRGDARTVGALHRIKAAAAACREALETSDLDAVGHLMHEGWLQKRQLVSGITNAWIDQVYDAATSSGATGGKITGAGGGGFLLLYCREERQEELTEAMEGLGLRELDFHLDRQGVTAARVDWSEEVGDGLVTVPDPEGLVVPFLNRAA